MLGLAVDGSLTDVGVFCVEAGRALCPRVVQSTVYAALALDWLGVGSAWLPRLTSGEARGDVRAVQPAGCVRRDAAAAAWADGDAGGSAVSQTSSSDADEADVIVASTEHGRRGVVDTTATGVDVEPVPDDGRAIRRSRCASTTFSSTAGAPSTPSSCGESPMPLWRWTVWTWSASARR